MPPTWFGLLDPVVIVRLRSRGSAEAPAQSTGRRNRIWPIFRTRIRSSSPSDVYKSLTTVEGLPAWWTTSTQGESKVGGVLQFRFGAGGFDMKVLELHPNARVLWQVVDGRQLDL